MMFQSTPREDVNRPEFRPPANPILVAFRQSEPEGDQRPIDHLDAWDNSINEPNALNYWLPEHVEHARKVLGRLARAYE